MTDVLGNLVWILPRPRLPIYPGRFPLHFEKRLFRLLGKPRSVLHQFGGKAEIGMRIDLRKDVEPDVVADAHFLPFRDEIFDAVICDPPYSEDQSKQLYRVESPLKFKKWIAESERVLKANGFLVLYHVRWLPKPRHCDYWLRIFVSLGQHHTSRIVNIFQKWS